MKRPSTTLENAVVKPVTIGFDPWEAHKLGGDNNTTNGNIVIMKSRLASIYFDFFDLSLFAAFLDASATPVDKMGRHGDMGRRQGRERFPNSGFRE